jgi:hypothetical protein
VSLILLGGLRRVGIDGISFREGSGSSPSCSIITPAAVCGPAPGRDRRTVPAFFDALGEERCKQFGIGVARHGQLDQPTDR